MQSQATRQTFVANERGELVAENGSLLGVSGGFHDTTFAGGELAGNDTIEASRVVEITVEDGRVVEIVLER